MGQGKENKALWGYWATSPTIHSKTVVEKKGSQEVVHVPVVAGSHACKLSERVVHAKLEANASEESRSVRGNKVFPPTLSNPCQNIHSPPIKRETNQHTQLIAAILKSWKDLERVSLGLLSEQHGRENPLTSSRCCMAKNLFLGQMVQIQCPAQLVSGAVSNFFFFFCGHSILMIGYRRR